MLSSYRSNPKSGIIDLSVVVPCCNEEDGIMEFHKRMAAAIGRQKVAAEIIYVNDGSKDATLQRLKALFDADSMVVIIDLSRNHGHQLAVTAGLEYARGDRVLIIDADLQDPPELLDRMMILVDQGADVVYGKRRLRKGESLFKLASASMFYRLIRAVSGFEIPADTGDFRLINRKILDALRKMPEPHRFLRGMVAWVGYNQVPIEYDRDPRFAGSTKYAFGRMLALAVDAFTGFAIAPLRIFFYISGVVGLLAFGMMAWTFYSYFFLSATPGWSSIMATLLLFSSIQLFGIALVGEYVGRTFLQGKERPLFLVKSVQRHEAKSKIELPEFHPHRENNHDY